MPAAITHELVAREAAESLSQTVRDQIFQARGYYFFGAQGPDPFFFLRPVLKRESNLGKLLHRTHVYDWFQGMLQTLPHFTGTEFEKCLSYALGFCSHLAADTAFHPFVYNFLEKADAPAFTHQEIENDWDVYFLRALDGQETTAHVFPFDLGEISDDGILYRFTAETAAFVGRDVAAKDFRRMLRAYGLYLKHTHTEKVRLLSYIGLGEFVPNEEPSPLYLRGKDFLQLSGGRGKDADALFRLAAEESTLRITAFLDAFNAGGSLPETLFSLHMLTGKPL